MSEFPQKELNKPIIIIAEAGVNHNGELGIAKKLIDMAARAGADYVKFQSFKSELAISKHALKAEYQKKQNLAAEQNTQLEMVKKLELDEAQQLYLISYCSKKKIRFLSTPFDLESIEFLDKTGIGLFKIPSGEVTNYPYLVKLAEKKKPVIMSTGMCTLGDIENSIEILVKSGLKRDQITLLHCNTEYPTPMEDVNLKAMQTLKHAFNTNVGYSDHTLGIEIPIAAAALGACIIEKHFTLSRKMEGPDHKASLEPDELSTMVKSIRNIEKAMGDGLKTISKSEKKNLSIARKSIMAKRHIRKGEVYSEDNLITKRPGTGISPMLWNQIIGSKANKDYKPDDLILL